MAEDGGDVAADQVEDEPLTFRARQGEEPVRERGRRLRGGARGDRAPGGCPDEAAQQGRDGSALAQDRRVELDRCQGGPG